MKMSEIFNLPVTGREFYQHIIAGNTSPEKDRAIANCINHADALADSLGSVLCTIKHLHYKKWLDDECDESVTFEDSASYSKMKRCFGDEIAALEAYRGAK